jgi:MFS superfamily sulfate permease-like transporter
MTPGAWLRGYRRSWLRADLVGGVTAGLVVVPQAMAYATIAGLPPQVGLYTCMVPMAVYALLGGSRTASVSTTSTIATLTGISLVGIGVSATGDDVRGELAMLVLLVGLVLVAARFARLGPLVDNVSDALMIGLKVGVGLTVAVSQLPKLLGFAGDPAATNFFEHLDEAVRNLDEANAATVALSVGTIAGLLVLARLVPRVPAPLVAVAAGIVLTVLADLPAHGVALIAEVPSGLPGPVAPATDHIGPLLPSAVAIALMAYLETAAVARSVRRPDEPGIDDDQELTATGLAAVGGAFFQAMPPAAGFSQTAVNVDAGSRSQASALVTVVLAVSAALFLGPVLDDLPEATLGALVFVAVIGLIKPSELAFLARFDRIELAVALLTAGVGLAAGLLQAVAVGVAANLLLVLHELNHPDVDELRLTPGGELAPGDGEAVEGLLALRIGGPLYTANAREAQRLVLARVDAADPPPAVVLLDATDQGRLTLTVLSVIRELAGQVEERGATLWFASLPPRALAQARMAPEWAEVAAEGRFHRTTDDALAAFRRSRIGDESSPPAPSHPGGAG